MMNNYFPAMSIRFNPSLPQTRKDVSMKQLIDRHKVFFLDAYGVFRGRTGQFPGTERTLKEIVRQGKIIGVAANTASSMPEKARAEWKEKGVDIPLELIFTAGMVLAQYVKEMGLSGAPALVLGNEISLEYARKARLDPIPSEAAMSRYQEAKIVAICENVSFHNNPIADAAVNAVFSGNIPVILTTTDRFVPCFHDREPKGVSVGVYATALIFKHLAGVEPTIIGKPAQGMFNLLKEVLAKKNIQPEEVLFVGDNRYEDITGAAIAGFPSLLVESGISGAIDWGEITGPVADWEKELTRLGVRPTYQLPSIIMPEDGN